MKHRKDLDALFQLLPLVGIISNEIQRKQIWQYLELLEKWSAKQNLVSRNDVTRLVERHFAPSLFLNTCLPNRINGSIMDLGSGAGFPGVLIKICRPDVPVTLLDSSRKKILFLQEVCEHLDLDATVVCGRCEDYWNEWGERYQIVVARAVARLQVLLDLASPLLLNRGQLYTIKGLDYKQEIGVVGDYQLRYKVHKPCNYWLNYTNYLEDKYVIDVEK